MNEEPQLLLSRSFSSFEELAATVVAWDLDFRQISRASSESTLVQIQAGETLLTHLTCDCFSRHAGATPENTYTIAVPDIGCSEFRYSNRLISRPAMIITGPGQEFELLPRPGYAITTFSVSRAVIDRFFESDLDHSLDHLLKPSDGLVFVDTEAVMKVQEYTRKLYMLAHVPGASPGTFIPDHSLESELLESILDALFQGNPASNELKGRARCRVLNQAMDYALCHQDVPLKVSDLVFAAQTTERTLERAFRQGLGMTPKQYLLGLRMSGVHHRLWCSSGPETSVSAIANEWGFWHMGQFAKDYRRLFGELPSTTLRKH